MKILNLTLLTVFLCAGLNLSATNYDKDAESKNPQSVVNSRYVLKNNQVGQLILSGGLTTGVEYNKGFGLQGTFDYRMTDRFSAGIQGNLYLLESKLDSFRQLAINLRGNYHLINQNKLWPSSWDCYVGLDLGGDIEGGNKKIEEFNGFVGVHTGARYKINHKWAAFAEVGTRNASIGLALIFN